MYAHNLLQKLFYLTITLGVSLTPLQAEAESKANPLQRTKKMPPLTKSAHGKPNQKGKQSIVISGDGTKAYLSTPEPRTATEHCNRGVELGVRGFWPDAIREMEFALLMEPSNQEFRQNLSGAHLSYGEDLLKRGKIYDAAIQFRQAMYVDPLNVLADVRLDECIERNKKDPHDFEYRKNLAESADENQDYRNAVVEWRKCTKLRDDGPTHAELGYCLLKVGYDKETVEGFAELRIAVSKDWGSSSDRDKMRNLAGCHLRLGDILLQYAKIAKKQSLEEIYRNRLINAGMEYRRAVTINPNSADAARGLVEVAKEAVAVIPSFNNHLTLAGAYQLTRDFERAGMELDECTRIDPDSLLLAQARQSLQLTVLKSPDVIPVVVDKLAEELRDRLKKSPDNTSLWYLYGVANERQGNNLEAADAYKHVVMLNPSVANDLKDRISRVTERGSPELSSHLDESQPISAPSNQDTSHLEQLAHQQAEIEASLRSGAVDKAESLLLAQIQRDDRCGRAWLLLGVVYERKDKIDLAVASYRQAANLKEPGALLALRSASAARIQPIMSQAVELSKSGNWKQATALYRQAAILSPELPFVHRRLADALNSIGAQAEAKQELGMAEILENRIKFGKSEYRQF